MVNLASYVPGVVPAMEVAGTVSGTIPISNNSVWQYWQNTATATTTLVVDQTWQYWNNQYIVGATDNYYIFNVPTYWQAWNTVYQETAEQRQAREEAAYAARMEAMRQTEERHRIRVAANSRAEELLMSMLSEQQAADYTQHGWFEVRGSRGGRWRIRNQGAGRQRRPDARDRQ